VDRIELWDKFDTAPKCIGHSAKRFDLLKQVQRSAKLCPLLPYGRNDIATDVASEVLVSEVPLLNSSENGARDSIVHIKRAMLPGDNLPDSLIIQEFFCGHSLDAARAIVMAKRSHSSNLYRFQNPRFPRPCQPDFPW